MANKDTGIVERSSTEKVAALLDPRNVVLVGASDRPGSWTTRVWRNLQRYNYGKPVYPLNPGRDEIWDVTCYKSMADMPEAPDHLVILVPAKAVPGVLRDGAAAGARSATVFSSGFDEIGSEEGRKFGDQLRAAINETGLAVSGPNCLGNMAAASSFVTMPDDRPQVLEPGPVAIVGQSGGLAMAIKRTLEERGINTGYVVTSGNEAGLTTADYIRFFAAHEDTKVIVSYLEAVHDRDGFLEACRAARAVGKPVVVMKLGTSEDGRTAALAHTGGLAGSIAAFDAVAGAAGAIRVGTLDDVVEVTEYMIHAPLPEGPGLGAITFSGGLRGLMLDAAERNGLRFPPLSDKSQSTLEGMLGAGSANVSDKELEYLHARGARGARVNIVDKGGNPFDGMGAVQKFTERLKDLGWHLEVLIHVHEFEDLRATLNALSVDVSVGHLGYMRTDNGVDHPGFKDFLDLLRDGNTWVKLSGSYRITTLESTPYHDVTPIARALIEANEDRIIWGTDWPHPFLKGNMPNDGALTDQLADWAPEETVRKKILVDNAERLYGF